MKILVFEFMVGGGVSDQHPLTLSDAEFLKQGRSMLEPVCHDFLELGHELIVPVDANLSVPSPPSVHQIAIKNPAELESSLKSAANDADAILVIAPETNGMLLQIVSWLKPWQDRFLMPSTDLIKLTGDKWKCWQYFSPTSVRVPATWRCDSIETARVHLDSHSSPMVVKPIDGAGSEGVKLIRDSSDFENANLAAPFLLQEFVCGNPVSIICVGKANGNVELLEPGEQIFDREPFGTHLETVFPLSNDLKERTVTMAQKTTAALPSFRGFIGLDVVLGQTDQLDCLIEVNPRLTTSYKFLRKYVGINLATKMLT